MSKEIQSISPEFLKKLSKKNSALRVEFVSSAPKIEDLPPTKSPEIAIVGRSNVGKSSLINFLAGQKQLARVSNTPGRTQLINLFSAENGAFYLADLPGYGYAESPRDVKKHWAAALGTYFEKRETLIGVLFLLDIRREITEEDIELALWFQKLQLRVLGVQTKVDKIHKSQWELIRRKQAEALHIDPSFIVSTSTLKKIGIEAICSALAEMLDTGEENDEKS